MGQTFAGRKSTSGHYRQVYADISGILVAPFRLRHLTIAFTILHWLHAFQTRTRTDQAPKHSNVFTVGSNDQAG